MQNKYEYIPLSVFLLLLGLGKTDSVAQTVPFDTIEYAIREGDTQKLSPHLNSFIDIVIDGEKKTYNKTQAEAVLRQFFRQHLASSFSFVHKGKSTKGTQYAIGHYKSKDTNYSVLVKTKTIKATPFIYMISFLAG